jgi:hypothetical protein
MLKKLCHSISFVKRPGSINLISIISFHKPLTVFHIIYPLTFINHSICKMVLTDSMSDSIFPLAIVKRMIRPCQSTHSIKFIIIIIISFISGIWNNLLKFLIALILILKIWIIIILDIAIDFRRLSVLII